MGLRGTSTQVAALQAGSASRHCAHRQLRSAKWLRNGAKSGIFQAPATRGSKHSQITASRLLSAADLWQEGTRWRVDADGRAGEARSVRSWNRCGLPGSAHTRVLHRPPHTPPAPSPAAGSSSTPPPWQWSASQRLPSSLYALSGVGQCCKLRKKEKDQTHLLSQSEVYLQVNLSRLHAPATLTRETAGQKTGFGPS